MGNLLTPEEVAEHLKVEVTTVWRWCRTKEIPAIKVGKYWRIPEDEFKKYLQNKLAELPESTITNE